MINVIPKAIGRKCLRSIISPFFSKRWKSVKAGNATLPTALPRSAPKNAPITKIMLPPAPPDKIPQRIPTNGSAKNIANQEFFSSSPTILPISLPEKYPTTAEITLTMAITPRIHKSPLFKLPELVKNRVNIAAGGNVPRSSPNHA